MSAGRSQLYILNTAQLHFQKASFPERGKPLVSGGRELRSRCLGPLLSQRDEYRNVNVYGANVVSTEEQTWRQRHKGDGD